MVQGDYTRILLSWITADGRTPPDLHKILSDLVEDINDRFEALHNTATGRSESITQTALTTHTTGLATTPQLGVGVLFQLSAASALTIPGFAGGYGGRVVVIQNTSAYTYTLAHESGTAQAEHRITSRTGASLTVAADAGIVLVYDDQTKRWIPVCNQL